MTSHDFRRKRNQVRVDKDIRQVREHASICRDTWAVCKSSKQHLDTSIPKS
jgi:hypothetical protein